MTVRPSQDPLIGHGPVRGKVGICAATNASGLHLSVGLAVARVRMPIVRVLSRARAVLEEFVRSPA